MMRYFEKSGDVGQMMQELHAVMNTTSLRASVCFPAYCNGSVGSVVRVVGKDAGKIAELLGIDSYEVPRSDRLIVVKRVQKKSGASRARRAEKRGGFVKERPSPGFPYVVVSNGSGSRHALFIDQHFVDTEANGEVSSYGLSSVQTIPWWTNE